MRRKREKAFAAISLLTLEVQFGTSAVCVVCYRFDAAVIVSCWYDMNSPRGGVSPCGTHSQCQALNLGPGSEAVIPYSSINIIPHNRLQRGDCFMLALLFYARYSPDLSMPSLPFFLLLSCFFCLFFFFFSVSDIYATVVNTADGIIKTNLTTVFGNRIERRRHRNSYHLIYHTIETQVTKQLLFFFSTFSKKKEKWWFPLDLCTFFSVRQELLFKNSGKKSASGHDLQVVALFRKLSNQDDIDSTLLYSPFFSHQVVPYYPSSSLTMNCFLQDLEKDLCRADFDAMSKEELVALLKSLRDRVQAHSPLHSKSSGQRRRGNNSCPRVNLMPIMESRVDVSRYTADDRFKPFSVTDAGSIRSIFSPSLKDAANAQRVFFDADHSARSKDSALPSQLPSPQMSPYVEDLWTYLASPDHADPDLENSSLSNSSYSSFSESNPTMGSMGSIIRDVRRNSIQPPNPDPEPTPTATSKILFPSNHTSSLGFICKTLLPTSGPGTSEQDKTDEGGELIRNEGSDFFSPTLVNKTCHGGEGLPSEERNSPVMPFDADGIGNPTSPPSPPPLRVVIQEEGTTPAVVRGGLNFVTHFCGPISRPLHLNQRRKSDADETPLPNTIDVPAGGPPSGATQLEDELESMRSFMIDTCETVRLRKRKDRKTGAKYINGYCIIKEIGRGSTSKVKLAYDNSKNRLVAIKQVRRTSTKFRVGGPSESQQVYMGFLREIDIVKKLRHKNIVSVYEIIDDPTASVLCLVMQYIDDGPIRKLEMRPNTDVVCEPIDARELKRVYLADFGVAETFDNEYRAKLERLMTNSVDALNSAQIGLDDGPLVRGTRGTMLFLAPELWTRKRAPGKTVDIWAMGVTLYTLLTGRLPFTKLEDIIDPNLPRIPTEYGEPWVTLLSGMLNRDSSKRLTSDEALILVSRHYLQERERRNPNPDDSASSGLLSSGNQSDNPFGESSCGRNRFGRYAGSSKARRAVVQHSSQKRVSVPAPPIHSTPSTFQRQISSLYVLNKRMSNKLGAPRSTEICNKETKTNPVHPWSLGARIVARCVSVIRQLIWMGCLSVRKVSSAPLPVLSGRPEGGLACLFFSPGINILKKKPPRKYFNREPNYYFIFSSVKQYIYLCSFVLFFLFFFYAFEYYLWFCFCFLGFIYSLERLIVSLQYNQKQTNQQKKNTFSPSSFRTAAERNSFDCRHAAESQVPVVAASVCVTLRDAGSLRRERENAFSRTPGKTGRHGIYSRAMKRRWQKKREKERRIGSRNYPGSTFLLFICLLNRSTEKTQKQIEEYEVYVLVLLFLMRRPDFMFHIAIISIWCMRKRLFLLLVTITTEASSSVRNLARRSRAVADDMASLFSRAPLLFDLFLLVVHCQFSSA
eukprot:gene4876-3497_t